MKVGPQSMDKIQDGGSCIIEKLPENHVTGQKECYRLENNSTLIQHCARVQLSSLFQNYTFSFCQVRKCSVQGKNLECI